MGRCERYLEDVKPRLDEIARRYANGATDTEICAFLGIGRSSFYRYRDKYRDFRDAIKSAKDRADDEVEAALFKRAVGYEYRETTSAADYAPGEEGAPETVEGRALRTVVKHVPPDVGAICFWLKNRRPERWRDRQEFGIGGIVPKLTEEENAL